jgi:hypothetical protein
MPVYLIGECIDLKSVKCNTDTRHKIVNLNSAVLCTVYIKSCSHEVAKHRSGVICQFQMTVPPLATTLRKMVTQSVRMGNTHACSLRTRKRQYTNPMSTFVSPKTFQSNKSANKPVGDRDHDVLGMGSFWGIFFLSDE